MDFQRDPSTDADPSGSPAFPVRVTGTTLLNGLTAYTAVEIALGGGGSWADKPGGVQIGSGNPGRPVPGATFTVDTTAGVNPPATAVALARRAPEAGGALFELAPFGGSSGAAGGGGGGCDGTWVDGLVASDLLYVRFVSGFGRCGCVRGGGFYLQSDDGVTWRPFNVTDKVVSCCSSSTVVFTRRDPATGLSKLELPDLEACSVASASPPCPGLVQIGWSCWGTNAVTFGFGGLGACTDDPSPLGPDHNVASITVVWAPPRLVDLPCLTALCPTAYPAGRAPGRLYLRVTFPAWVGNTGLPTAFTVAAVYAAASSPIGVYSVGGWRFSIVAGSGEGAINSGCEGAAGDRGDGFSLTGVVVCGCDPGRTGQTMGFQGVLCYSPALLAGTPYAGCSPTRVAFVYNCETGAPGYDQARVLSFSCGPPLSGSLQVYAQPFCGTLDNAGPLIEWSTEPFPGGGACDSGGSGSGATPPPSPPPPPPGGAPSAGDAVDLIVPDPSGEAWTPGTTSSNWYALTPAAGADSILQAEWTDSLDGKTFSVAYNPAIDEYVGFLSYNLVPYLTVGGTVTTYGPPVVVEFDMGGGLTWEISFG